MYILKIQTFCDRKTLFIDLYIKICELKSYSHLLIHPECTFACITTYNLCCELQVCFHELFDLTLWIQTVGKLSL